MATHPLAGAESQHFLDRQEPTVTLERHSAHPTLTAVAALPRLSPCLAPRLDYIKPPPLHHLHHKTLISSFGLVTSGHRDRQVQMRHAFRAAADRSASRHTEPQPYPDLRGTTDKSIAWRVCLKLPRDITRAARCPTVFILPLFVGFSSPPRGDVLCS
jgi:hypothetical protein